MQVETCQVGGALRLDSRARVAVHRRHGTRDYLDAMAPVGTDLILDGVSMRPITLAPGIWTCPFSVRALHRFTMGRIEVQKFLPNEWVPLAADFEDWLHIGIAPDLSALFALARNRSGSARSLPATVAASHCPLEKQATVTGPSYGGA